MIPYRLDTDTAATSSGGAPESSSKNAAINTVYSSNPKSSFIRDNLILDHVALTLNLSLTGIILLSIRRHIL